jgi:hypothetical protein
MLLWGSKMTEVCKALASPPFDLRGRHLNCLAAPVVGPAEKLGHAPPFLDLALATAKDEGSCFGPRASSYLHEDRVYLNIVGPRE